IRTPDETAGSAAAGSTWRPLGAARRACGRGWMIAAPVLIASGPCPLPRSRNPCRRTGESVTVSARTRFTRVTDFPLWSTQGARGRRPGGYLGGELLERGGAEQVDLGGPARHLALRDRAREVEPLGLVAVEHGQG